MVPIAEAQADQVQALFTFTAIRSIVFHRHLMGDDCFHEPLSRITKLLDR